MKDEKEDIATKHLKSNQGWSLTGSSSSDSATVSNFPPGQTGTITNQSIQDYINNWNNGNIITAPGTGNGIISSGSPGYYDSGSVGWNGTSDLDLDMDDFIELLESSREHRTDLLESYARMILDKLHSMPNNGGLDIPESDEDFAVPNHVGENFARVLATAWGYPMCSVGSVRVYRDGTFKFKLKV